jgi:glycine/D-amino acid oxidase-like deaminating enzyme
MKTTYDILILGAGPIGSSTAYFLSQKGKKNIGMITAEPTDNAFATYQNAGGCVRWFWDDAKKAKDTKETADFIKKVAKAGVDLSLHEDTYLFLNRGKHVPAVNISSAKLMTHFQKEAKKKGVKIHEGEVVKSVTEKDGIATVTTSKGEYTAKKVLLALGAQNPKFMHEYEIEEEKRYLLILDTPVNADEKTFPHTIIPIKDGVAFLFIKKLPEGWRFVLGQENILEVPKTSQAKAHYKDLLATGLGNAMPFLKKAKVERMLAGVDVEHKNLLIKQRGSIYAASCGSAVRSCVPIGKELAAKLSGK